jgi:hypothetical protein
MKQKLFFNAQLTMAVILTVAVLLSVYSLQQSAYAAISITRQSAVNPKGIDSVRLAAPIAISGNNILTAWPNNDTGHWGVFFAKSTDGGKTLGKTIMLSAPNKGKVVNTNVDIAVSGSDVVVTWWTNKTGTPMPVFKASSNDGDTFGKTMILNSTSAPP